MNNGRTRKRANTNLNNFSSVWNGNENVASVFSEEEEYRPALRTVVPQLTVIPRAVLPQSKSANTQSIMPAEAPIAVPVTIEPPAPIEVPAPAPEIPIMQIKQIQGFALVIIRYITDALYSLDTIRDIYDAIVPYGKPTDNLGKGLHYILEHRETYKPEDLLNFYRFYVKGSSATVLLDEETVIGSSRRNFPYSIDSDIDAQLLINPFIVNENKTKKLRFKLMQKILERILKLFDGIYPDKATVTTTFASIQRKLEERFGTQPVTDKVVNVLFADAEKDTGEMKRLLEEYNNVRIPDTCPFGLRIYQNYGYMKQGRFVPLNFSLIRVYIPIPNSTKTIDIIDITVPFYSLTGNNKSWILSSDIGITRYGYIQGPIGHYVNQTLTNRKMAVSGHYENQRKVTRRRNRIRKIKENIYGRHKRKFERPVNTIRRGLRTMGENTELAAQILAELVE